MSDTRQSFILDDREAFVGRFKVEVFWRKNSEIIQIQETNSSNYITIKEETLKKIVEKLKEVRGNE